MKSWPWGKIFFWTACFLVVLGISPLAALMWHFYAHNFQPLSMQLPLKQGTYTSAVFKTDLDESYMIQIDFLDATQHSRVMNPDAVLDMDWKIVDDHDAVVAHGTQGFRLSSSSGVNLGDYHPQRGLRQRIIIDMHRDLVEPNGSSVTLEVNSTEDPEGRAFGYGMFLRWAVLVAGPGVVVLLVLLFLRIIRRAAAETFPGTLEML